ncbi:MULTISPECIES: efflux RND transporter periplasmic adaptor subunit [Pseudoalteromonas]|uniref:Efflux RND transporter periplasmic adaptor subunit n=1 Tax=Pseudoalteromonas qingdaonensis TaxID=3131913 RepID=A0ABU9MW31_9GAMM|nr:efflux RND transporter periplasmic adaptor subunit [Pseudoalteromonas sp. T1lg22]
MSEILLSQKEMSRERASRKALVQPTSFFALTIACAMALSSALLSTNVYATNTEHVHTQKHDEHAQEDEHNESNDEHGDEDEHSQAIHLTEQSIALANIKVAAITPQFLDNAYYAPGEIKANGYTSYIVSPRTDSVVVSRHAMLGEHVEKGQTLVTLFSESMAQAQSDYLVASTQWQRVKKLDQLSLSDSELLEAQSVYKAAFGKLIALGLTPKAIDAISQDSITSFGEYSLVAHISGMVISDEFTQGQRVAAGEKIMTIADEKALWVEAKVPPNRTHITVNTPASIVFNDSTYPAKVIQEAHTIDPQTRTQIIRLSVNNSSDTLHAGMFVNVYFHSKTTAQLMAVPQSALMRSPDGDWQVFVEQDQGEFLAQEVQLGQQLDSMQVVHGLQPGQRIAIEGAFFIASEQAKSGFDPHNH